MLPRHNQLRIMTISIRIILLQMILTICSPTQRLLIIHKFNILRFPSFLLPLLLLLNISILYSLPSFHLLNLIINTSPLQRHTLILLKLIILHTFIIKSFQSLNKSNISIMFILFHPLLMLDYSDLILFKFYNCQLM